jgi:hypothetical protein
MMSRTLPRVLGAALLLIGGRALAEAPSYVIGWWDGAAGSPGMWFRAEGPAIPDGVALQPVTRLEAGRVVQPAPGRIVVSAELALLLGVPPRTPTLLRLARPDQPSLDTDPPSRAAAAVADAAPAPAAPGGTPQERIVTLLAELQELTAEATRADATLLAASTEQPSSADPSPATALAAPAARHGGLVPFFPAGAEP